MRAAMGERKMKAGITRARVMTERMIREKMISIMAWDCTILVLLISIGSLVPKAAAQSDRYPKIAPVDQYLMERNAEILLAPSAAPDSISSDAARLGRSGGSGQGRIIGRISSERVALRMPSASFALLPS